VPYLLITSSDGQCSSHRLKPGQRVSIGRSGSNDVVLRDPALSRHHAELSPDAGGWVLNDNGSRNGTFVDGRPVRHPTPLRPGSRISVGGCTLLYSVDLDSAERVILSDEPLASRGAVILRPSDENTAPGWAEGPGAADWQAQLRRYRVVEKANLELLAHEPVDVLLPKVIDLVFEAVNPERAALLINEEDQGLVCRAFRGDESPDDMHVSRTVADAVVNEQVSVLTSDAQADPRFRDGDSLVSMGVRAVMAVPLRRNDKVIGLIYADSRLTSTLFKEEDLRVLTMLANIVAIQIENAQRLEERQKRVHYEQELKAAAALQRRLLPRVSPQIGGYVIEGVNVPCFEVGGDYYDYVKLDDGKYGIVLADVAGKGLEAGMLMMGLQATFHAEVALNPEPDELMARLNKAMIRNAPRSRFVTMCYVELDSNSHRFRWANAGHSPAPIVARAGGGIETLGSGNVPLGILEGISYPVSSIDLEPGDLLVMCSDGVTETIDDQGNEFGLERLEKLIVSLAGRSPSDVQRTVEDRLEKHAAGARPSDDLTMIVLQRTPRDS